MTKNEELLSYAQYCNDELGEMCQALIDLDGYSDYLGDDLKRQVKAEIAEQLTIFKTRTKIVSTEMTTTYTDTELVWDSE